MPKKTKKRYLEELYSFIENHSLLFVIGGFLLVNLLFNYNIFWSELITDRSVIGQVHGEVEASEFGMETVYRNLLSFKNPFSPFKTILYPFELEVVGSDVGIGFNLLLFRPFFSLHQASSMVVVFNLFFANIAMYLFLRKLKNQKSVSFIIALAYGFMTFLTVRLGHLNYTVLYLFPFFYYFLILFFTTKKSNIKIMSAVGAVFILILSLWQNMYYFIMLFISCIFFAAYYVWKLKFKVFTIIKDNAFYVLPAVVFGFILLSPWLQALYDTFIFSETPKPGGWGGAILFSADLFGVFIPSQYNYYYGPYVDFFIKDLQFTKGIFENFTYPGVIILVTGFLYVLFYKRLPKKLKETVQPTFFASILFFILTLGPFLHIFGRWALTLDEGIKVVVPLPFVLLHYIPFINNIRSPGRFIVAMIFFAYIFVAYLLTYWLKVKSKNFKIISFAILLIIFLIDHRYTDTDFPKIRYIPNKVYLKIAEDKENFSVLRIPFTVRDGYTYFGDYGAILVNDGQLIFNKPVVGGYSGRIANYVKTYYQNDSFLGYLGRFIDYSSDINPGTDNSQKDKWKTINIDESKKTLDFLSIKYVIVDENFLVLLPELKAIKKTEKHPDIKLTLKELGFEQILRDNMYTLWMRKPAPKEFLVMDVGSPNHNRLLGHGWYNPEENYRWVDKESSSLFKVNKPRNLTLNVRVASFYNNQPMTVYVNKKKLKVVMVKTDFDRYSIDIPKEYLQTGINYVYYIFDKSYQPAEIFENNLDKRKLGGKFKKIIITDSH